MSVRIKSTLLVIFWAVYLSYSFSSVPHPPEMARTAILGLLVTATLALIVVRLRRQLLQLERDEWGLRPPVRWQDELDPEVTGIDPEVLRACMRVERRLGA